MKKILFLLLTIACSTMVASAQMQDVVYLKNGGIIRGILVEQIPNESVKIQTKDGSVFVYTLTEIAKITKENAPKKLKLNNKTQSDILMKYRGEVNVGFALGGKLSVADLKMESETNYPMLETIHGVLITDYFFIGGGTGLQYYYGYVAEDATEKWNTLVVPLFVNMKGFVPLNENIKSFVNVSLGGSFVGCSDFEYLNGGLFSDLGVGVKVQKVNFGLGWQHKKLIEKLYDANVKYSLNAFYFKVGIDF